MFSDTYIVFILVSSVAIISFKYMSSHYMLGPRGCLFDPNHIDKNSKGLRSIVSVSAIHSISWAIIVALLVYLLVSAESTQNQTNFLIRNVIKTAVISLLVCVVSNIITSLVVVYTFPKWWPRYPTSVMYDFSLVIDSVSIVMSYLERWNIIFGWLPTFMQKKQPEVIVYIC